MNATPEERRSTLGLYLKDHIGLMVLWGIITCVLGAINGTETFKDAAITGALFWFLGHLTYEQGFIRGTEHKRCLDTQR
jgi:hypothetical protein